MPIRLIDLDHGDAPSAAAGFAGRFVPVAGVSHEADLPEMVDLIVSEILGNLVGNEGCMGILADAVTRLLGPGGRRLPWRAQRLLVPVHAPEAHATLVARRAHPATATGPAPPFDAYYDAIWRMA